jgi:hypothetical protein
MAWVDTNANFQTYAYNGLEEDEDLKMLSVHSDII